MTIKQTTGQCYQCGEDLIVVKVYKEYVRNSLVTTTESICSDPICQKRTDDYLKREKARIADAKSSKLFWYSRGKSQKKSQSHI